MSVEIKFWGQFSYEEKADLKEAKREVKEFLKGEEKSIRKEWKQSHKISGKTIEIDLHTSCPEDDFLNYEGIVETFAEYAADGKVLGWRDDYEEGDAEEYLPESGEAED